MYVGNKITAEQLIDVVSLKTLDPLNLFEVKPTQSRDYDLTSAKECVVVVANHAITSVVCLFATPVVSVYGTGTKYMNGEGASRYFIAPFMGAAAGVLGIGVGVAGFLAHAASVPVCALGAAYLHSLASLDAVFSVEQPNAPKVPVTHDTTGMHT